MRVRASKSLTWAGELGLTAIFAWKLWYFKKITAIINWKR